MRFAQTNNHTNFVITTLPHRYDLEPTCLINKEINQINYKMKKICKENGVKVIELDTFGRRLFTPHGLHLNKSGKSLICKKIIQQFQDRGHTASTLSIADEPEVTSTGRANISVSSIPFPEYVATPPQLQSLADFPPLYAQVSSAGVKCNGSYLAMEIPVHVASRFLGKEKPTENDG